MAGHIAAFGLIAPEVTTAQAMQTLPSFVDLYEQQGAAVVSIRVASNPRSANSRRSMPDFDPDDLPEPFRRFFQQPNPNPRGGQAPERDRGPIQRGGGSGFVVSADGFVVTNHHVIENADEVTVVLTDKREFKAKVVGSDSRTDTALLKIEATGLKAVKIGDPNALRVGEWVVAIGQPFGLENTLTKGIVSAKGRNVGDRDTLAAFIQHDAAVNPGNSGGPLFNLKGEVVGVNSMIYTRSGAFSGLSFAVPIDQAMDVVRQLQTTGRIQRGRLGVAIGQVTKDAAEAFGLPRPYGALVSTVEKDTAAEKAGLQPRDIITKFDGKTVNESSDLPRLVTAVKPGTRVPLEVWRDGKAMTVYVMLGEFKPDQASADAPRAKSATADRGKSKLSRIDIEVSELNAEERKAASVKNGVQIESIRGRVRNLENGDIIIAVVHKGASTEVNNRDSLDRALAKVDKGGVVSFQIRRSFRGEWNTLFVTERIGDDS
jgi:serine protease Do